MQPVLRILTQEGVPGQSGSWHKGVHSCQVLALGMQWTGLLSPHGAHGPEQDGASSDPGSSSGSATDGPELRGYLLLFFFGFRFPVK